MLENPPAGLRSPGAQRCSLVPYECRNGLNRAPQPGSPTQPHAARSLMMSQGQIGAIVDMGSRQKPRHTVGASAQRETPAQVSLTQPPSERELDKSHSFFCDILLRLFWSRPSVAFLQRSWGNIIQLPPCDPRHTTNPVVHSSVAKEKDPSHNVLLRIRTFKGIRIVPSVPRLEM